MRVSSGSDVPGCVSQCMRKSRSLKFGSSEEPSVGKIRSPATIRAAAVPSAGRGRRMIGASAAP
jgi:hypothetical protein